MKWYAGNIAEAVQHSKKEGAVFFVGIFGNDEQSKKLEEAVESTEIQSILSSTRYVCIRLTADSQEHVQFKQIYSNAVSPCLYFISLMGAPVEIIHGDTAAEDLKQRCESAWSKHSKVLECQKSPQPAQAGSSVQEPQPASTSQNVASGTVPVPTSSRETTPSLEELEDNADTANMTLEQRIERARQLAAARAQLKLEQEAEEERKRELERREAGKGMAELKRWQEEQEAKRLIEERKREKREEQELRQKIRDQIAQDRAERNKRTNASIAYDGAEPSTSSGTAQKPSVISSTPANYAGKARLQFRMPNGSSQNHNFDQDVTLGFVRNFLIEEQHVKFSNFSLCVAFPRRMFTADEYEKSLKDLGLLPSAALLVIPAGGNVLSAASGSGGSAVWLWITTLLGYLLFPVTYLFGTIQRALPSSGSSSTQPPKPSTSSGTENRLGGSGAGASYRSGNTDRRSTGPTAGQPEDLRKRNVKSEKNSDGNIHRLRNQETDSDEDLGTWNGNSTQQKPR
ncbi:unnamed protein product [Orchesella dallaii]|uniref:UBX domain-containing protein 4 n=1 Tax=Orchesella dallaii TaxID=48710 RepID=A0ABP1QVR1_9HEXA